VQDGVLFHIEFECRTYYLIMKIITYYAGIQIALALLTMPTHPPTHDVKDIFKAAG